MPKVSQSSKNAESPFGHAFPPKATAHPDCAALFGAQVLCNASKLKELSVCIAFAKKKKGKPLGPWPGDPPAPPPQKRGGQNQKCLSRRSAPRYSQRFPETLCRMRLPLWINQGTSQELSELLCFYVLPVWHRDCTSLVTISSCSGFRHSHDGDCEAAGSLLQDGLTETDAHTLPLQELLKNLTVYRPFLPHALFGAESRTTSCGYLRGAVAYTGWRVVSTRGSGGERDTEREREREKEIERITKG